MKKSFTLGLCLLLSILVEAAPVIRAVTNNGNWSTASTWNLNRKPQSGDTIVIPTGITVVLNSQETLNNVYIQVYGSLKFANVLSFLSLNATSSVVLYTGATIQATINFLQFIFLGGSTIFNTGTLTGPMLANTGSGGFISFNPLPVKFLGFTLSFKANDVWIQWSTSMEMNVSHFEVERSFDNRSWNMIGSVDPSGNNVSSMNNYSFQDRNPASALIYYRVKEVDIDGRSSYTSIQLIKMDQTDQRIRIAGIDNRVLLQFPTQVKGKVEVRFFNFGGQLVDKQWLTDPFGQVILNAKVRGGVVVSVTNEKMLVTTEKIML